MKEAIGNSFIFTLVMTFAGILIAIYVGSIAYSKGFKIRNKIIDIIELHEGYDINAVDEINESLSNIGYRIHDRDKQCPTTRGNGQLKQSQDNSYRYCVYEYDTEKGRYYGVTVFIYFDVPLIGNFIEIPLYGESRLILDRSLIKES